MHIVSTYDWYKHADDFTEYQIAICHALSGQQVWMSKTSILDLFDFNHEKAEAELAELIELGIVKHYSTVIALNERL